MDAGAFGNRLGLDAAYQFARGDEVVSSSGIPVKLSRPLDWLVIADHSDNMGFPAASAGFGGGTFLSSETTRISMETNCARSLRNSLSIAAMHP